MTTVKLKCFKMYSYSKYSRIRWWLSTHCPLHLFVILSYFCLSLRFLVWPYASFVSYKYARLHWSLLHLFQLSSGITFYWKISESWKKSKVSRHNLFLEKCICIYKRLRCGLLGKKQWFHETFFTLVYI